ncbi:MAG: response regulator, partial [Bradymonadaceae bacterium]
EALGTGEASRPSDQSEETVGASLRVLVAEDSPVNQTLLERVLGERGHEVDIVDNGEDVVARHAPDRYDVILMDLELPGIDGYEATRRIRRSESDTEHHTPVIAMTAHAMKEVKEKCLEAGMDEYLSKPARADALFEKLASISTT